MILLDFDNLFGNHPSEESDESPISTAIPINSPQQPGEVFSIEVDDEDTLKTIEEIKIDC